MPDFSFFLMIMPTYNLGYTIRETIDSCIKQHFNDFEIRIIDGGSSDDTEKILVVYDHPKINYHKKTNVERATACNYPAFVFEKRLFAVIKHLMLR